jgi:predicted CXXCH cytochrome family protein
VYLNWTPSADTIGTANYRIYRRSSSEAEYSAIATTTGGVYDCAYIDSGLSSSTRYWYAVSTVDSRGESSLSDTTTATWNYTAPTTTLPDRIIGVNVVNLDSQVYLSWQAPADPAVYGYVVLRGSASMSTMTTISPLPPAPILGTGYFDSTVANGETYYYQVAAINTSQVVGIPSVEAEAKPLAPIPANQPQPHSFGNDSACICHATHSSTTLEPLVRFPGATRNTICKTCHAPVTSANNFTDPLLQSKHPMGADVTSSDPYTCTTCHVPLARNGTPLNNLMKTNSSSPCVVVTDTPAGNGFCYSCHGPGSTLVMGDLSVFQSSGHNTVPAPTNANIVCDTCHESHSSRNPQLLKYSGFMVCMQCHTASASNPAQVDILSRLMLNNGANSKHPLLPQDQTTGARMTCENCHNTHTTTTAFPLVDPHNPGPTGTWPKPRSDEKAFCFRCHDGSTLPTSAETTPWASAVFARGRVTTTAPSNVTTTSDIQTAYQVNQHGFGSRNPATTTANLRPDMGYGYGDVLECRSCHDPHGTANDNAILETVKSANGSKSISGVLTYRISGGGKDFRFFCTACHVWDSASHDARASSITGVPTDTGTFPANCKKCHGHTVVATGTPEPAGWYF